jgi:nicotinamidase-related amidase
MTKTALLVVDVQKGFINEHTAHIPALIQELLPSYQTIFATRFYNPEGSNYRRLMKWHRFSRESPDTELAFTPTENVRIIDKPLYTCVTDTFLATLDELAITEIHIVGIDTDICVSKCAVDLFERGRTPFVLAKYCASHAGPDLHNAALQIIARYIGKSQIISYVLSAE